MTRQVSTAGLAVTPEELRRVRANDLVVTTAAVLLGTHEGSDRILGRLDAARVAEELTAHDALAAHLEAELHISQEDVVNPWHAAWASAAAFLVGAILPMIAILLPPPEWRIITTFVAVVIALAITGWLSAWIGGAPRLRAITRVVVGGALALAVTWIIGALLGGAI